MVHVVDLLLLAVGERICLVVPQPARVELPVDAVAVHVILNAGLMRVAGNGVHLVPLRVVAHGPHTVHEHDIVQNELVSHVLDSIKGHLALHEVSTNESTFWEVGLELGDQSCVVVAGKLIALRLAVLLSDGAPHINGLLTSYLCLLLRVIRNLVWILRVVTEAVLVEQVSDLKDGVWPELRQDLNSLRKSLQIAVGEVRIWDHCNLHVVESP
jgi:hypothetical protein